MKEKDLNFCEMAASDNTATGQSPIRSFAKSIYRVGESLATNQRITAAPESWKELGQQVGNLAGEITGGVIMALSHAVENISTATATATADDDDDEFVVITREDATDDSN